MASRFPFSTKRHEVSFRARLAGRRAALHRRRFQLRPADRRRRRRTTRMRFSAFSPPSRQPRRRRWRLWRKATMPPTTALLAPTVPLSREIFRAPTRFYKAGIAFLTWLNGHQTHFIMPARLPVQPRYQPLCRSVPSGRRSPAVDTAGSGRSQDAHPAGPARHRH